MKPKHLAIRIAQCLELAKASNCPRRKFGAQLLDPTRNVVLMDAYNGGPRGGSAQCGGEHFCVRDGYRPEDLAVVSSWLDTGCVGWYVKGASPGHVVVYNYKPDAEAARDQLLAAYPPIPSGQRMECGCHHSESNLVASCACSGVAMRGHWVLVTGEPCLMCAKLLHHAGVAKVICIKGGYAGGSEGVSYLQKHGVEVDFVEGPQDPRLDHVVP